MNIEPLRPKKQAYGLSVKMLDLFMCFMSRAGIQEFTSGSVKNL